MSTQWLAIRDILQQNLQSGTFKVWIAPLHGEVRGESVRVVAPNAFVADWVRNRLAGDLEQAAQVVLGGRCTLTIEAGACPASFVAPAKSHEHVSHKHATPEKVTQEVDARFSSHSGGGAGALHEAGTAGEFASGVFTTASGLPVATAPLLTSPLVDVQAGSPARLAEDSAARARRRPLPVPTDTSARPPLLSGPSMQEQLGLPYALPSRALNWRYDFSGFVVGPCNELAHAAARSMTRDSAAVDTLFLSSASGLGKTHLSQAVGQAVCLSGNRSPRVEYLTAEEFSSCFVQAMKARDIERFKARFRDVDMLLLEDVEFLQKKEKMQDEVLSTIKTPQSRGSRVILTSSFAPRDLRDLDDQLVSRFCSGFMAGIEKPDFSTRRRILLEKATAQQAPLSEDVADLLAGHITADVRRLESCLCNLLLKARLLGREISVELAREVLMQFAEDRAPRGIDDIIRRVCEGFGLSAPQLQSRSRRQNLVVARNAIFFLARKHTDMSLQDIGDHFGRRHSTVIKGIAAIERELKRETPLGRQVAAALARIEAC